MSLIYEPDAGLAPLEFAVTRNLAAKSAAEREQLLADPAFGTTFTDHMVDICWSVRGGWHRPRVQPYGPLSLDPAAAVLHYGQEIFEGIKAYRHADGSVWTFRPDQNGRRLQRSARRLALPELPVEYFIESLKALIAVDGAWVPSGADQSLYLRPFMFAKEAFLGVRPANKVGYYVIASPVGAYFKGGAKPVSIWLSEDYARAGKGGTGAAKTGGNYAASLLPQAEAYEQGCDQVVFLDQDRNVEELGGMNVVFVYKDGTIVTPQSDSILEGITRDSILQLAADRGHKIEGRAVSIDEWRSGVASGEIVEVFACGTAAVVAPIGVLKGRDFVDEQPLGPLAQSLRDELTDIQYGRRDDTHGWLVRLDEPVTDAEPAA
ncbi:branched-chain amino acid aminotransferase [Microbacterium laevaniformans]|uniref:branched-chain-amino-acid transaminase n=2 Tax=Microbacterium TaxID=33882 RepID=A0A4S2D9V3_9MICO|nr:MULTISPECIES: branched-chain amino acid aminotransferase [Microbacterium]KIC57648.1 branched-chain amino acid aminotransferase [Microbacterium hominis]MDC7802928.1 branched-chain amino acid aminotransferase [Sphingomonas sp. BLCC-B65]TGY38032.1 branched-chain amino acid aminotransferase [Microbacterium laevaniformans]